MIVEDDYSDEKEKEEDSYDSKPKKTAAATKTLALTCLGGVSTYQNEIVADRDPGILKGFKGTFLEKVCLYDEEILISSGNGILNYEEDIPFSGMHMDKWS